MREYLDRAGNVFAVSWSGPVLPDLQRLLGAHFAQYTAALAALEHPGLHRSVRMSRADSSSSPGDICAPMPVARICRRSFRPACRRRNCASGSRMHSCMRSIIQIGTMLAAALLSACIGGNGTTAAAATDPAPTQNTLTLTVDSGPAGATGAINHAYVTVKVCVPGSQTQCANIDHVLLDTGSSGLRLVRSVLAAHGVTLSAETDAQGRAVEECVSFGGGQTWGPVALADVTLAGEVAAKLPVQVMDDTGAGAPPPASCGANGTLINGVTGFDANGVLGVGVFAQDCGQACVNAATPLPLYYGCTAAGACTAENVALADQVTNPVAMFAVDNNGLIVDLPNLHKRQWRCVGARRADLRDRHADGQCAARDRTDRAGCECAAGTSPRPTTAARPCCRR